MDSILIVGTILFVGFILGEFARAVKLPKVTGYIIAGVLLNPEFLPLIPKNYPKHTDLITNIALAFITFSVGGTLLFSRLKRTGKMILSITFWEGEMAFLCVAFIFILVSRYFLGIPDASMVTVFIPLGLLIASLAAPTDPSATLAVIHEYKAKGEVSSTVMGVAAFDDILGIINYSLAVVISGVLITRASVTADALVVRPFLTISGALLLGAVFGVLFNFLTRAIKRETEGMLIVLIFGLISLCFGFAGLFQVDQLLPLVAMGVVVVNFNRMHSKIFTMLERYTEELVFVLFFTISGMHLDFSVIAGHWPLIVVFVVFRTIGKYTGVAIGGGLAKAPFKVRKYVAGGLIPQGGIVVGLALLIQQNPAFSAFSDILINTVIGATVVHELIGPVFSKISIAKAGEISKER